MKHFYRILCMLILLVLLPLSSFADLVDIDVEVGIKALNQFVEDIVEVRDAYLKAFHTYNYKITQVWASECAVEEYNKELDKMLDFPEFLNNFTNSVVVSYLTMYSFWKRPVDSPYYSVDNLWDSVETLPDDDYTYIHTSTSIESDEYGVLQGINPVLARQYLDDFIDDCRINIYPKLAALTLGSGFVYTEGSDPVQRTFQEKLTNRAARFLTSLDELSSTFDELTKGEREELRFTVKEEEENEAVSHE